MDEICIINGHNHLVKNSMAKIFRERKRLLDSVSDDYFQLLKELDAHELQAHVQYMHNRLYDINSDVSKNIIEIQNDKYEDIRVIKRNTISELQKILLEVQGLLTRLESIYQI